jgi:hypothetical protein
MNSRRFMRLSSTTSLDESHIVRHNKADPLMAARGHFRQIDPLPTLSACPLRSDRVRTFAPQPIDAVCQEET